MHENILAKSSKNGGVSLFNHLKHVAEVAIKSAQYYGLNLNIIRNGAYLHDIGKAHPDFQKMLFGKYESLKIDLRHEISSIMFLSSFPKDEWEILIDMVIAHHRSPIKGSKGQGIIDLVNIEGTNEVFQRHTEKWNEWSENAIDILASLLQVESVYISLEKAKEAFIFTINHCKQKKLGWSKYKGLMNGADHFASALNEKTYELIPKIFRNPDLSYFDSDARKSSLYPLSLVGTENQKLHTLVVAPTGAGKTDFLMRRCKTRVFYTLPFQASINAMYERFKLCLPKETDIRVLHASSSIQVSNSNEYEEKVLQPMMGSAVKVLTPHQLASLICGTRGFESIAIDISNCDVILDEIHSYSDVSQSIVIEIIKVLRKLNCRIHIGSATMPSSLVYKIIETLGGDEYIYNVKLSETDLDTFNRHIIYKHENETTAFKIINNNIDIGNKILIVCNRVDVAQRRYNELKKLYPDIPILLLHSRFRRMDKATIERKLKDEFNNREYMPGSCIVVSTQVVEVSLDINFDLMITDAAPLDSLIQRFGRVNRYRTKEGVERRIIKYIHIIAPPTNSKDCLPYNKQIVDKSFEQLIEGEIVLERELQSKIDAVYPRINVVPIDTLLVWEGDQFLLRELCHFPKSVLIEALNIDSLSCIKYSDKDLYEISKPDDRIGFEIPIPRTSIFRKFTNFGKSKYGSKPIIIPDELYDSDLGLQWKEINNIF